MTGLAGEGYCDCDVAPIKDESGKITKLIQITRDVTKRVKIKRRLERTYNEPKAINEILSRLTKEDQQF